MKHRPFLKWAGNKYSILNHLQRVLPPGKRLIEPFTGSGAVFLNTAYPRYLLAEKNNDLVALYTIIQSEGDAFFEYAREWIKPRYNQSEKFYELRARFNEATCPRLKSALFIYLNRHGFNGLCRYNSQGKFNVPFGQFTTVTFPTEPLRYFYQRSQQATFVCQDFEETLSNARRGDVVYCDPPYAPLSKTAGFTGYQSAGFTEAQQSTLANWGEKLSKKGIPVIISNHDTPFTRQLYDAAELISFPVKRHISADPKKRIAVPELIAIYR